MVGESAAARWVDHVGALKGKQIINSGCCTFLRILWSLRVLQAHTDAGAQRGTHKLSLEITQRDKKIPIRNKLSFTENNTVIGTLILLMGFTWKEYNEWFANE